MKNVMIPEQLFMDLLGYHILEKQDTETEKRIRTALYEKVNAMERRETYTKSKTAATPDEREAARLKYLELAKIDPRFRW